MAKKRDPRPPPRSLPIIVRKGIRRQPHRDLYHALLRATWPRLLLFIAVAYVAANAIFALLYLAGGNCIANTRPDSFMDAFFFSVQTMATIGYGTMAPIGLYANVLVAVEAFLGLLGLAVATGLMFAKFSRPTARVVFSRVAVVGPRDGVRHLLFRMANERANQIVEAHITLSMLRTETTAEGESMRRFHDLRLSRDRSPFFTLTWTAMHPLDESSPLYGCTPGKLVDQDTEFVITLAGIDETYAQKIHARHTYGFEDIVFNARFADILRELPDGSIEIDYAHFHETIPLA